MMKHFTLIMAKKNPNLSAVTLATDTSLKHSRTAYVTYDPHTTAGKLP